jgi:phosphopantetheinyl transferase (holo-ACP synthase)
MRSAVPGLCACGIDAETPARFRHMADDPDWPMPFVFSRREIEHCRALRHPEQGLCAAFCCKEAFFKAIGVPYNYPDCELLLGQSGDAPRLIVDRTPMREHRLDRVEARILSLDAAEVVVVVDLYSRNRSANGASAGSGRSRLQMVTA